MKNRTTYHDHGLVFAKEYGDLTNRADLIGQPLQANHLGERHFDPLIKAAKVKRITFHGMRHTCATLLLQANEPVHVVSKRLGHARVEESRSTPTPTSCQTCRSRRRPRWGRFCMDAKG